MPDKEGSSPDTLFAGLARTRFGFGMTALGISAALRESLRECVLSLRGGGARLYIINGMSCESANVMEHVYEKVKLEEVVPEMREERARSPILVASVLYNRRLVRAGRHGAHVTEFFGIDGSACPSL